MWPWITILFGLTNAKVSVVAHEPLYLMKIITMYMNVILYDSSKQMLTGCAGLWYLWYCRKSYFLFLDILRNYVTVFITKVKTSEVDWQKFYSICPRTFWSRLVPHASTTKWFLGFIVEELHLHNGHGPPSFRPTNQEAI